MDKKTPPFQTYSRSSNSTPRPPGKSLYVVLLILLIIVIAIGVAQFLSIRSKEIAESTPAPIEFIEPPEEPLPSAQEENQEATDTTPSPTTKEAQDTKVVSDLKRADFSIEILNGSGTAGAASKLASLLKKLGYSIASTGNADTYDYTKTEISVTASNKNLLELLKKDLEDSYTIGKTTTTYKGTADAQIIIGEE